ncbi:hypothetical protein BAS09_13430 [Elizabethkingia ursingii]|uniref:hypothetical protein n=1 Tax=Elizabethkingia ursingii TaxID=1756150 RepID=UPI00099923A4|nr:hypothetical protein [Elizabethkingia ursingii]OPC01807.1 hypothetical protein BAS09_13430 [Elizabethkingia ursingii]
MWKIKIIGFCLLIGTSIYCYSQETKTIIPQFTDVKIQNHEGMVDNTCIKWLGKSKCLHLLQEFELAFNKTGNNYADYYRSYYIMKPEPDKLWITLIPRKLMEVSKKTKQPIPLDSKFLEISYDLKTKKISKPVATGTKIIA